MKKQLIFLSRFVAVLLLLAGLFLFDKNDLRLIETVDAASSITNLTGAIHTVNPTSVTIPSAGKTETITLTVCPASNNGTLAASMCNIKLQNLPTGVTNKNYANGVFTLEVDSSATAGTYRLTVLIQYGKTIINIFPRITLNAPIIPSLGSVSMSLNKNSEYVPYMNFTNVVNANVKGMDKYGNLIQGLSYKVYNLPYGVSAKDNGNGNFALEISSAAQAGTYTIYADAISSNTKISTSASLTLYKDPSEPANLELDFIQGNPVELPAYGSISKADAVIKILDQYGQDMHLNGNNPSVISNTPGITVCLNQDDSFTLTIKDIVAAGSYPLTLSCDYGTVGLNGVDYIDLYRNPSKLSRVEFTLSQDSVNVPLANQSVMLKGIAQAYDQYNAPMNNVQYSLCASRSGFNIQYIGNGNFAITATPALADLSDAEFKCDVSFNLCATDGTNQAYASRLLIVYKQASELDHIELQFDTLSPSIDLKHSIEYATCKIVGYSQYGRPMQLANFSNYSITGFPAGVNNLGYRMVNGAIETTLELVSAYINPSTYPITASLYHNQQHYTDTVNFTINKDISKPTTMSFVLQGSSIIASPKAGNTETLNALLTVYDQYCSDETDHFVYNFGQLDDGIQISGPVNGICTITLSPNVSAGTHRITVTASNSIDSLSGFVEFEVTKENVVPSKITLDLDCTNMIIPAGTNSEAIIAEIEVWDQYGEAMNYGLNYTLSGLPNNQTINQQNSGIIVFYITSAMSDGNYTITASAANVNGGISTTENLILRPSDSVITSASITCKNTKGIRFNNNGLTRYASFEVKGYDQYGYEIDNIAGTPVNLDSRATLVHSDGNCFVLGFSCWGQAWISLTVDVTDGIGTVTIKKVLRISMNGVVII